MMLALRAFVQGCSPKPMLRAKLLRESCDTRPSASVRSSTKARTASLQASVISWSNATSSRTPCHWHQGFGEHTLFLFVESSSDEGITFKSLEKLSLLSTTVLAFRHMCTNMFCVSPIMKTASSLIIKRTLLPASAMLFKLRSYLVIGLVNLLHIAADAPGQYPWQAPDGLLQVRPVDLGDVDQGGDGFHG